ncbi:MAG: hypothetical protein NZ933_01190 [Bacteroidia bacterium]|nr:hypothetical protein [Bacteroidia bacterium]
MAVLGALCIALYVSCQGGEVKEERESKYVGDSICASCHAAISKAYASTWKAHSFQRITSSLKRLEDFQQSPVYDPHRKFYYHARWEGDTLVLYEYRLQAGDTVYIRRERLDYVIGSGHQTRSYLLFRNGFLYEAPLTWYSLSRKWDLSPGYAEGHNSRFSREIQPSCLFCHASGWISIEGTYNQYSQLGHALGCESCHGPGSQHVANPKDPAYHWSKWSPQRQMDVCSRCHLEGIAIEKRKGWKPGDSLAAYWVIFLPERPELGSFGIASHVERLLRSTCFQRAKLTCTTCHDPHPLSPSPSYDKRCISCHEKGCSSPSHPRTECVKCHMPKGPTSDIPHAQFTDHYIRVVEKERTHVRSSLKLICATEPHPDSIWVGQAYLKWYNESRRDRELLEQALSILGRWGPSAALAQALLLKGQPADALPYAEEAIQKDSTLSTMELYCYLLEMVGALEKALDGWHKITQMAPFYPDARFRYTLLAYQLGRITTEEAYQELYKLTQIQPWNAQLHYNAAIIAGGLGKLELTKKHLEHALAYEPDYELARQAWNRLSTKSP